MQAKTRKDSHWIVQEKGRYCVRSKIHEGGKTRYPQRSFIKRNEAERYLKELVGGPPSAIQETETTQEIQEQASSTVIIRKARSVLVYEILESYRDSRKDLMLNSKYNIDSTVKSINQWPVRRPLGRMVAAEVRQTDLQAWADGCLAAGQSAATVACRYSYFSAAWNSHEEKFAALVKPKMPKAKETNIRQQYISREQQIKIGEIAAKKDWKLALMWLLGSQLALRIGEIVAVRWEDITRIQDSAYPYGYITVDKKIGRLGAVEPTKTKDIRVLAMTPQIWSIIKDRIGEGRIYSLRPLSGARKIRDLLLSAGETRGGSHRMRHTAATSLLLAGASISETKAVTGHRSLRMLDRYEHTAGEIRGQAAARLGAWLASE
jgi:integrase